jgi:flavodoxin
MRSVVIYDSLYGNTKQVAEVMAKELGADIFSVEKIQEIDLAAYEIVVIGSPTHGGRPTPAIHSWLNAWTVGAAVKKVVCFDTRMNEKTVSWWLTLLMKLIGYAADKMKAMVISRGAAEVVTAGFLVTDKEGPLAKGELTRARNLVLALT